MRLGEKLHILKYMILPATGILFVLFYIQIAGADVVYSDYIRLINEYLPDVADPSKFLVPDILTRIPATYLARLVNVSTFSYSVTFDRILSVLGLGLIAACMGSYMYRHEIGFGWQAAIWIVLFSLNKWEILLNGSAWAHMVSFGFFFVSYLLLDLVWTGEASVKQEFLLLAMPFFMLLFAGEYIASYACTLILVCLFGMLTGGANSWAGRREQTIFRHVILSASASLVLYLFSRHYAVWEHAGATELGLREVISRAPFFIPKFFMKTFAGAVIGQETIENFFAPGAPLPNRAVLILGMLMACTYVLAFLLYFRGDMLERTIFPMVLLISGFANHVLVTMGRWIFLNENYALSSRYGGQFMIGLLGILLIFAMYERRQPSYRRRGASRRRALKAMALLVTVCIVFGNCYTTYQEIRKAKYREANYERMAAALLNYEEFSPEELAAALEWHKDPQELLNAVKILQDNKLNVFSRPVFEKEPAPGRN